MKAPLPAGKGLIMAGWIDFPNWMGSNVDTAWSLWHHGDPQDNSVTFGFQDEIVAGTMLEMAPGNYESPTGDDESVILQHANYYCEQDSCPVGDFIVCNGKTEVCGIRNGVRTGNMDYIGQPWPNLICLVD